jgi:hypothetical protein
VVEEDVVRWEGVDSHDGSGVGGGFDGGFGGGLDRVFRRSNANKGRSRGGGGRVNTGSSGF